MGTSFYDTIVPEMNELDFDLGSLDTFEDLDINMATMDMMSDTTFTTDPFGDFSLEQSFDLIELNKLNTSDSSEAILEDYLDDKETLKQDIMWSSSNKTAISCNQTTTNPHHTNNNNQHYKQLSLTPPSSYINQIFNSHECHPSPISSDEDTCHTPHVTSSPHVSDHCYTSLHNNSSSLLTPPESSEDEDSLSSPSLTPPPSNISKSRKNCLSLIANDRLNKGVKSLLKSTQKNLTHTDKPKFKLSIRMKKMKNVPFPNRRIKKKQKQCPKITIASYQALKENKQTLRFTQTNRQTVKIGQEKLFKTDKLNSRDARDVHNEMERQRRSDLNREYAKLKDYVPSIASSDRTSKQIILDKAIEHCIQLRNRDLTCRDQLKTLSQKNQELRKKLMQLESQLMASQVENAKWEIQGW